jgi:hypothetical protein
MAVGGVEEAVDGGALLGEALAVRFERAAERCLGGGEGGERGGAHGKKVGKRGIGVNGEAS